MTNINEVTKIGNKYYLNSDLQKILEGRIKNIDTKDIEDN